MRSGQKGQCRLGWVAVVNTKGESIMESHVNYPEESGVSMFVPHPSKGFGVAFPDLKMKNGAIPGVFAEEWIVEIIKNRKVIVHGGSGDRKAFFYITEAFDLAEEIIDTQHVHRAVMKLSDLHAREFPGAAAVQVNGHTPLEDARATMELYLKARPFDRAAEKARLEAKGTDTVCKASSNQVRQVQQVQEKHRKAAQSAENFAKGKGAGGFGGASGGGGHGRGKV